MKKDSWLYSDSFLKRAFAIWGYHAVAGLIISIPFMIIWLLIAAMFVGSAVNGMRESMVQGDDMQTWQIEMQLP